MEEQWSKGNSKGFALNARNLTRIKPAGKVVRGIMLESGEVIHDPDTVGMMIAGTMCGHKNGNREHVDTAKIPLRGPEPQRDLFTAEDVEAAIKQFNFSYAIGPYGFIGHILNQNKLLRARVV